MTMAPNTSPSAVRLVGEGFTVNDMPRVWGPEYHRNRYLRHLSASQLLDRAEDVVSNLLELDDDRKYRPKIHIADSVYRRSRNLDFPRMLFEIWEEERLRGGPQFGVRTTRASLQKAQRLADETWCSRPDWVQRSQRSKVSYDQPTMLFKFNETEHNRRFFESGEVQVSPALTYRDPSLNSALVDNELERTWYSQHGVTSRFSVPNYYCMCFAGTYDLRFYRDFRKHDFSCVAISDVPRFMARLAEGTERLCKRDNPAVISKIWGSQVFYYDPFFLAEMQLPLEAYFSKHFRFAYQEEFRVVMISRTSEGLAPFTLHLGPMSDIAEFIHEP